MGNLTEEETELRPITSANDDIRKTAEYFKSVFTGSAFGIKVRYIVISNYNHLYVELFTNLGEYRWYLENQILKGIGDTSDTEIPEDICLILSKVKFKTVIDTFGDVAKLRQVYSLKVNKKRVDVYSHLEKTSRKLTSVNLSNKTNFALPKGDVKVGKNLLVSMVYESNRIEGSKLTFAETMDTIENVSINASIKLLLKKISSSPEITIEELAEHFNKDPRTIIRNLETLKIMNFIRRVGSRKTGYWEVLSR